MNFEYVGRSFQVDSQVRAYAEEKLDKAMKFLEEPVEVRVTLEVEKHRQIADIHVSHRHGTIQATEETDNMYEAMNLAADKVEKQARRARKKQVDRRRRPGRKRAEQPVWPMEVLDRRSVGQGEGPRIIKTSALQIKPMSIEEAALQLESSKNDFVVFRDSRSDRVHVLYKRRDENYGLIAPEV